MIAEDRDKRVAPVHSTDIHIVLVHPQIHWNTGNAGRSCLAAGAQLHLIEPLGFSLEDKQVRRAGLDYWPRVQPRLWPDWPTFEARLPELGEPFLFSPESPRLLWEVRLPERTVMIFGSETAGLPDFLRSAYSDRLVSLPMQDGSLRSLNLSTCVGMALYEALRQKHRRE